MIFILPQRHHLAPHPGQTAILRGMCDYSERHGLAQGWIERHSPNQQVESTNKPPETFPLLRGHSVVETTVGTVCYPCFMHDFEPAQSRRHIAQHDLVDQQKSTGGTSDWTSKCPMMISNRGTMHENIMCDASVSCQLFLRLTKLGHSMCSSLAMP